jgi:hypothetical protein
MSDLATRFMNALQTFERERNLDAIAGMFTEGAALRRAPRARTYAGRAGAKQFWAEYLDAFEKVETQFGDVTSQDGRAVLEWHSQATSKQGHALAYDGCTVIEGDGDLVRSFRTYYDAASAGMGSAVPPEGQGT